MATQYSNIKTNKNDLESSLNDLRQDINNYTELGKSSTDEYKYSPYFDYEKNQLILKYIDTKFKILENKIMDELTKLKNNSFGKTTNQDEEEKSNQKQTEIAKPITSQSLQIEMLPMLRMDLLKKFNNAKTSSRKIFDSEETMKMIEKKKDLSKSYSLQLKNEFFSKIKNQSDLLFINFSEKGHIFGCYCRKPCTRADYWVEDEYHRLFSYNGTDNSHTNRTLEIVEWKSGQSYKSFYFKSSGDYLYANMGIVIQSVYDKPYSQVHSWLGNNYECNSKMFVNSNDLFTTIRTMVIQLK